MNRRKIAGMVVLILLGSFFIVNQIGNDTWDDTHWGGDTGEEEYHVPQQSDGTRDGDGGEVCSMIFFIGFIGGTGYYIKWKRNKCVNQD